MRRIVLLFTVAAMMAAMLVSAGPANALVIVSNGNSNGNSGNSSGFSFNSGGFDIDGGDFDVDGGGFNFNS